MRPAIVTLFLVLLAATSPSEAQDVKARAQAAATMQAQLRSEGCSGCRVWVSGSGNTTVKVLDLLATSMPNDYKSRPVFWYGLGFRTVIYYSKPNVVYARHSLD